jgi:hypothetical protein
MFIPRLFWGYSMAQEKIDEFADLWALMYCVMAREMVDSFGEEGKEALIRAIKNYGIARGERLKARHEDGEKDEPVRPDRKLVKPNEVHIAISTCRNNTGVDLEAKEVDT